MSETSNAGLRRSTATRRQVVAALAAGAAKAALDSKVVRAASHLAPKETSTGKPVVFSAETSDGSTRQPLYEAGAPLYQEGMIFDGTLSAAAVQGSSVERNAAIAFTNGLPLGDLRRVDFQVRLAGAAVVVENIGGRGAREYTTSLTPDNNGTLLFRLVASDNGRSIALGNGIDVKDVVVLPESIVRAMDKLFQSLS